MVPLLAALLGTALQAQDIEWRNDLPETLRLAKETRTPVIAVFEAAWCPACRRFKSETLSDAKVRALADRFLWVQTNIDREVSVAREHDVQAIPRFDLIDPDGVTRVRVIGVLDPDRFRARLEAFLENPPSAPPETIRADDLTPLTRSPEGYRGLSICFANVGYGVLNIPAQSPFQALRVGFRPRTPSTITKGAIEARVTETWVNLWAFERGDYLIDYETLRSSLSLAYGLSDVFELDVEVVDKSRFGGSMDKLIQGFHNAFNISQGGRDEFSKNQFVFNLNPSGSDPGISIPREDRGSFSHEFLLALQHNITCGTDTLPALAYSLSLRADDDPTGDRKGGSPVDAAISASASKSFGDFYGYAGLGVAWFGKERFRGVEMNTTQGSLLLALEWRYAAASSFLLQYLGSENIIDGPGPFGKVSSEFTLGWKTELQPGLLLELGLIENIVLMDNSPDLGFHAGLTWRF